MDKSNVLLITDSYKVAHNTPYDKKTMRKLAKTKLVIIPRKQKKNK